MSRGSRHKVFQRNRTRLHKPPSLSRLKLLCAGPRSQGLAFVRARRKATSYFFHFFTGVSSAFHAALKVRSVQCNSRKGKDVRTKSQGGLEWLKSGRPAL